MPTTPLARFHSRPELEAALTFSAVVRHGNLLYLAGCISCDQAGVVLGVGDIATQVRNIYTEISALLKTYGSSMKYVVKESGYTVDMAAMLGAGMPVRTEFYAGCAGPAATWVQIEKLAFENALLEIEVMAALPSDAG